MFVLLLWRDASERVLICPISNDYWWYVVSVLGLSLVAVVYLTSVPEYSHHRKSAQYTRFGNAQLFSAYGRMTRLGASEARKPALGPPQGFRKKGQWFTVSGQQN
jgi:hypothetical protein